MLDFSSWNPDQLVLAVLLMLMITVVVVVAIICIQAGLFHAIHIRTQAPEFEELTVMYKTGQGAYNESGPMFTEAHSLLPDYNTIAIYYDDPEKKSTDNLRYIVGLVLAEGDQEPKAEDVALMEKEGYKMKKFPKLTYAVTADFPYTNTLSCIFSVFRVYPALREYIERRELCAHPFIEVYHNQSSRILFTGPLEQQDLFYVPEVQQDPSALSGGDDSCEDEDDSGHDTDECGTDDCATADSAASQDNWDQSASVINDAGAKSQESKNGPGGSEESDTNTASSFEEIDAIETTAPPKTTDSTAEETTQEIAKDETKEELKTVEAEGTVSQDAAEKNEVAAE